MPKYLKKGAYLLHFQPGRSALPGVQGYRHPDSCATGRKGPHAGDMGMELKFPLIRERLYLPHIHRDSVLKEVQVKPYYGKILLVLVLETGDGLRFRRPPACRRDRPGDGQHRSHRIDGPCVPHLQRRCCPLRKPVLPQKEGRAVSIMTKGKTQVRGYARLRRLSLHHDGFMKDMMHKISTDIIRYCVEHGVGTLVIGTNRGWKQGADMGKANDQNFVSVPHDRLRKMIGYKAAKEGSSSWSRRSRILQRRISPQWTRCRYTEKRRICLSFPGGGRRRGAVCRGYTVNADCNAAANILRKAVPGAWDGDGGLPFPCASGYYWF